MRFVIDAWLERKNPSVGLLDAETGREVMRLGPRQVRELMESGDLWEGDFRERYSIQQDVLDWLEECMEDYSDPTRLRAPDYLRGGSLNAGGRPFGGSRRRGISTA